MTAINFSRKGILLIIALCLGSSGMAQMQDTKGLSAGKLKKLATNAERYGDTYTAIKFYEPYAAKKQNDAVVQYHLATLYERTRDYLGASEAYLQSFETDISNPDALFNHIRMLKMTGEPQKAREKLEEFEGLVRKNGYESKWRRTIREEMTSCDTALALLTRPFNVIIDHAGSNINGPHAEFAPIPFGDDQLIYGAIKETEIRYFLLDSVTTRRRLYISEKVGDIWMESSPWKVPFNDGTDHVVNGTFNADQSLFVYTRCAENWKKEMECNLWAVRKQEENWGEPEKLDNLINVPGFINTQPALTSEPKKGLDILYFSSNRPDGQGGMDLYFTQYDPRRKSWKKPRNLGRRINGPADEITPFYNEKEKKLYFSSASHPGIGGLDVFSSRGEMQRFVAPVNVGYPINSSVDELYYVLQDDRESGYFVSNRKGGYQMMNETCCDDIYEFWISDVIHLAITGFVMKVDAEDYVKGEGDKLSSQSFNSDFLDGVDIELYLIEDSMEVLMERKKTGADGMYLMDFEPDREYRVVLSRPGFFSNSIDVDTRNRTKSDTLFQNVGLSEISGKSIVIDNILFDFDSSELTPEAKAKISSGILNTLKENPHLIVELSAHTDNKGDATYNLNLSQERAESVTAFLTANGIPKSRLIAKGYGETRPIASNALPDGSDDPEGRALNRRTEFTIIGELDRPVELDEEEED